VELFRHSLKKGHASLRQQAGAPAWAFLYNLDLYRREDAQRQSPDQRLSFQTGSQAEQPRLGRTMNGLDPDLDYQVFCYVTARGDDHQ
jgi:hypothetical protein